jgi:general stress protein 26
MQQIGNGVAGDVMSIVTGSVNGRSLRWVFYLLITAVGLLFANPVAYADARQPEAELTAAIFEIAALDSFPALVTIDAQGQPRIRTVEIRPLANRLEFWFATRPNTRKVSQIRANPLVALYFSVDAQGSYVSVSGTATIHTDLATKTRISWRSPVQRVEFWPDYPNDYVLVSIEPQWIEVLGQGIDADPLSWRPQRLVIAP